MKKTNYYVLSLLMAAGLAACSAEIDGGGNDGLTPISLTATVEDAETTRAGTAVNNAFSSGDAFTAYFPENVRIADATTASSTSFSYNGTKWTPTTQPYFNAGTTSATIHAYYGKVGGASGTQVTNSTTKFTVATDQSTDEGYKASDLMYATNTIEKSSPTTSLTFSHKMAKIIVNATAGDGISEIQDVRIIGGHRSIDVNMTDCTLGTTLTDENSPSSYITMYSGGTTSNAQCAALVVPETSGFTGDFLEIVTDRGNVKYSLTNKVLNSGKSYTFVLAVTAAAIGSTVAITGWTDSADATVTAGGGDFTMGDIAAQTYNGSAKTPTPTVSYNNNPLTLDTHYTLQYVNNIDAGTAAVIAIGKGSYVGKVGVKEFTINKANPTYTAPTAASLTYNGNAQNLVTAGSTSHGTIKYSTTEDGTYSETIPQQTNAGTYNVWWKLEGDENHNDVAATQVTGVSIAKANCTVQLSATSLTIAPSSSSTFTVTLPTGCNGTVSAESSATSVATTTVSQSGNSATVTVNKLTTGIATITVTVAESDNYNAYTATDKRVTVTSDPGIAFDNVTSSHQRYYIATNGKAYQTLALANTHSTAVGYICYAGSVDKYFSKFIAIALEDAHTTYTTYSDAQSKVGTYASNHPVTYGGTTYNTNSGSTGSNCYDVVTNSTTTASNTRTGSTVKGWRIPTVTDWRYIFQGLGGPSATNPVGVGAGTGYGTGSTLRSTINTACGNEQLQSYSYWCSSELSGNTGYAWGYNFNYSYFNYCDKAYNYYVRAVFAY